MRDLFISIHDKFMNLSFKYKTLIMLYSIIGSISLLIGCFSYIVYSRNIQEQVSNASLIEAKQIKNSIDFIQHDVNELSTFITLNSGIQSILEKRSEPDGLDIRSDNDSLKPLLNLLASKNYISFIILYANNGFEYYLSGDNSFGINHFQAICSSSIVKASEVLKGRPMWITLDRNNQIFIVKNLNPKIAMCRTILNTNTMKESGFMVICLNLSSIQALYLDNIKNTKRNVMILDDNSRVVSFNNKAFQGSYAAGAITPYLDSDSGKKIITLNNEKLLLTYSTSAESGWRVVYTIPLNEILKNVKSIMFATVIIILLCLAVAFVLSIYVSSILSSPLKKLLSSMNRVKSGNFKEKVDFKYKDEIGLLGNEYNDMIDYIHNLIDRVLKLQIQEKEAELKALEAQINPHFLYNTLDSIYWKALISKNSEVSDMVYSLSKIFRLTLNRGNEFTSVANEKEFIEHYLSLQNMRFKTHLEYEIRFDAEILEFKIPKLILQPFIENSIIHGVECIEHTGKVSVLAYLSGDHIHFEISDNGNGIDPAKISSLLSLSSNDSNESGYAIKNVNQRLFFYYGNSYSLNIESQHRNGTKVMISIPIHYEKIQPMEV